jgi:hypothetical protein
VAGGRQNAAIALGAVLVGLGAVACSAVGPVVADPGPQQTQTRTISAVSTVDLAATGELVLTGGDTASLRITAGRNVIGHLTSAVHGDRLTLGSDGSVHDAGRVRYDLVLPAARVMEVSGSGSVEVAAPSALQQVLLPGSGRVRVDGLRVEQLTVDLSGSGEIAVAGSTTRQRISIGGSGRYSGGALASRDAEVTISGSGSADITASRTLTVTVSGSGAVTYSGDATVHSSVTGSGAVVRR